MNPQKFSPSRYIGYNYGSKYLGYTANVCIWMLFSNVRKVEDMTLMVELTQGTKLKLFVYTINCAISYESHWCYLPIYWFPDMCGFIEIRYQPLHHVNTLPWLTKRWNDLNSTNVWQIPSSFEQIQVLHHAPITCTQMIYSIPLLFECMNY